MEKQITQTVILLFTLCHQWNKCGRLQFLVQKQSHKNCRFERSKILQKFSYNHLGKKNSNEALQIHLISYFFLHIYFLWGSFSLPFFFFLKLIVSCGLHFIACLLIFPVVMKWHGFPSVAFICLVYRATTFSALQDWLRLLSFPVPHCYILFCKVSKYYLGSEKTGSTI